jgi:hypothetical protein
VYSYIIKHLNSKSSPLLSGLLKQEKSYTRTLEFS